jgi:heptosyltransferase-1
MALLRNAACIVGGDTGPLHLAVALGTPSVALFGPTDPARNGPYRANDSSMSSHKLDTVIRKAGAVTTYKRGDQPDSSLLKICVDEVFDSVRQHVEASR